MSIEPSDETDFRDDRRYAGYLEEESTEVSAPLAMRQTLRSVDLDAEPPDDMLIECAQLEKSLQYRTLQYRHTPNGISAVTDSLPDARRMIRTEARHPAIVELVTCEPRSLDRALQKHFSDELSARATDRLFLNNPAMSARTRAPAWMKVSLASVLLLAAAGAVIAPHLAVTGLFLLMLLPYVLASMTLKGLLAAASLPREKPADPASDGRTPIVTIMVPLKSESLTLPILIESLRALDYPKSKLDVKLLIERDDSETRDAIAALALPDFIEVVEIPLSKPQTKPKAMNYALPFARGEIIGIYDAEDVPDAGQIRKAVDALDDAPGHVVCVQARLNHYNGHEHWLARSASTEYSLWFDMLLNGLSRLELPIPLGGTSLFIKASALRAVDGWDPDNVTEDADLGVRLARQGWQAKVIDSTTIEEAPDELWSWICQRTRWIKGFMVTWIVHMRDPAGLVRQLGWRKAVAINVMLLDGFLAFLAQPLFLIGFAWWALTGSVPWSAGIGSTAAYLVGAAFVVGQLLILMAAFIATRRRFGLRRALWTPMLWLYWQLGTIAAYRALWQLFRSKTRWEKTGHGTSAAAKQRREAALRAR